MQVRDYECDLQGVVNNANYLHYLEHTRHQFLLERGYSFATLHQQDIDLFVSRIDIRYRQPLRAGDSFLSCLSPQRQGPRLLFRQAIFRLLHDGSPDFRADCVRSDVECVAVIEGRLSRGDFFDRLL